MELMPAKDATPTPSNGTGVASSPSAERLFSMVSMGNCSQDIHVSRTCRPHAAAGRSLLLS